jgi:NAD(P)H-dependent flavin oxidoreductase YrpB (nitropropane dioxygenase family)
VAAVSNAGGIGTLGAIGLSPSGLRATLRETRALLRDPALPIGVDLLLPKVGEGARKTNKDYTGGRLAQLVDVMVEERVALFVCAVGVPPKHVVDRLHAHGIHVMNMIGSPRHVAKCLEAGVDIIAAQGTEGGGHTGDISTLVLVPQVVDLCAGTGVIVVGAGGVTDGRSMAACFALGAEGVWVGSRFLMTTEANVPRDYQAAVVRATSDQTVRTLVFTGRPARGVANQCVFVAGCVPVLGAGCTVYR